MKIGFQTQAKEVVTIQYYNNMCSMAHVTLIPMNFETCLLSHNWLNFVPLVKTGGKRMYIES